MNEPKTVFSEQDEKDSVAYGTTRRVIVMKVAKVDSDEAEVLRAEFWEREYNMWRFFNKKLAHVRNLTQLLDLILRISRTLKRSTLSIACTDYDALLRRVRRFITWRCHVAHSKTMEFSRA